MMTANDKMIPLEREFYLREADKVAPELLGKLLVHRGDEGITSGVIVEVEAYIGSYDKGAHSYPNKLTERTRVQFGPGGHAYIYAIYGMHCCFNVVTNVSEKPEAVLVRALEPIHGITLMQKRRNTNNHIDLCNGPGKLCEALGITKEQYGYDLCSSGLYIADFKHIEKKDIAVSPRINIDYAGECKDYLWRYFIKDNPCVSKIAKKYRDKQKDFI